MDALSLLFLAAFSFFFVIFVHRFPTVGLALGLLIYASPILRVAGAADLRIGLIPVMVGLGLRLGPTASRLLSTTRSKWLFGALIVVLFGYFISLIWTNDLPKSFQSVGALVATILLIGLSLRSMTPEQVVRAVYIAMGVIVSLSLIQGALGVPDAIAAGRLRGITGNSNALGVTSLIFAAAAFARASPVARNGGWVLALFAVTWTASRAGTAAVVLLIAGALWVRLRSPLAKTGIVLGSLSMLSLPWWLDLEAKMNQSDSLLFRTNDSRSTYIQRALSDINETWPLGIGVGGSSSSGEAGVNVVLKLASEIGVFSIPVFVCFLVLMLKHTSRAPLARGVFIVCLANNMFEGWLLTFGNIFTLAFFVLIAALPSLKAREQGLSASQHEGSVTN